VTRLNFILYCILISVGLLVVTAQHQARKLHSEYEELHALSIKYKTEFEQLQLEQSTWAMHSRVEEMATQALKMEVPNEKRVQVIILDEVIK
jgi:cell division protein FtsL